MMYVTTLDVIGLTAVEYRAVLDKMGVETRPAANIFLHLTTPIEGGYRIVEIWDSKEGFGAVTPLHNFFAPRLQELPGLIDSLPGAPNPKASVETR
jgi:hypothetical protein